MTVRPVASTEPRHQPVIELGRAAAARLDDAGAHLAQYVAEREDLLFIGPQRRDMHALRIVVALVARHRQAERAALDAVAHDILHLFDFIVRRGAALGLVAHDVIAYRRMADQIADIDAQILVEPVHVLRDRLPIDLDGVQHFHRDRFDIGQELGDPLGGAGPHRRQGQRAIAEDDSRAPWSGENEHSGSQVTCAS